MRCDTQNVENLVDFARQGDGSTCEELIKKDLDWIKPKSGIRLGTVRDSPIDIVSLFLCSLSSRMYGCYLLRVIAFAEIPQAYLVEIMQPQASGD